MKILKNQFKKIAVSGLSASVLLPFVINTNSTVLAAEAPEVDAESALVVDFETNQILLDQNADDQRGIASMTKMMVEYILFQEIEAGNLDWNTEVTISDYAYQVSQNYELSNVPLKKGEVYSLEELYQALAIYSANGATVAIAEQIAGSEPAMVDRMHELVESWGITDYEIYNTTGLSNASLGENIYPGSAAEDENVMSAKGIATVASHLLKDYPEVLDTSSIPSMVFREGTDDAILMKNWNWMLEGLLHERPNVDGLKTGTTPFAGANFTGTSMEDGRRIITVVMGAGDGIENKNQRFDETDKIMDYGFNEWEAASIMEGNTVLEDVDPIMVRNGKEDSVEVMSAESLEYLLPNGVEQEDVTWTFDVDEEALNKDGELEAPIEKGQEIGTLTFTYEGENLGYLDGSEHNKVSVVTAESVDRAGFFSVIGTWFSDFFGGLMERF
ncbi:D-Ala-D-Ala carboxypeptidase A. Serine peptidase. MEROPS family S11 [Marinilactibacillus piezotolerans]|uniref:serine-type D-Ala-D-Ala carboxypeptidase n=1 Tax=Marinilactibacillus piezotolerans TaxID=258723 RepID=A0A1I4AX31_9LACT|nr:serine hydrolase [Marinilactibacillus piezotolerans]SFK61118.1 D-Ala-D-Ala carboxypeptidase A. Serine peptidase. MEROPS family S11 [Marinilactibacillus piezotolerans]